MSLAFPIVMQPSSVAPPVEPVSITFGDGLTASPNPITGTGDAGLAPIPTGTILGAIGAAPQGIPSPLTMDEILDATYFNGKTGILARSYGGWQEVSGDPWSVLWMAGETPGFGTNACAAPIPLLLAESKILGLSDINAAIDIAGGSLVITAGSNPGGGSAASFNIIGGSAATQGGHLVLQGGVATAESGDISGGGVIIMGGNQKGVGTDGFVQIVSRTEIQLYGSKITFNQLGEGIDYSTLTLSSFDPDNNIYSLVATPPSDAGYVWTSSGPDNPASWQPVSGGDASAWATFPAQQNVNLAGFNIKSPPSDTAVNMTIALPDISGSGNVTPGSLIIGGDINNTNGPGSDTYIRGGYSQSFTPAGTLFVQAGINADGTWGDTHFSATNIVLDTPSLIDFTRGIFYSNNMFTMDSSSGSAAPIEIRAGATLIDGSNGADVTLASGTATTGQPGDIHITPATNTAGTRGSTNINGSTINVIGTELNVGTGSDTIANCAMVTGIWGGDSSPVLYAAGTEGQFLGITGDGSSPPSFQTIPSATNWSSYRATTDVNLNGYNIKGPEQTSGPAQDMTISLPDIDAAANISGGDFILGGNHNNAPGQTGSDTYIYSGSCQSGSAPGDIHLIPLGNGTTNGDTYVGGNAVNLIANQLFMGNAMGSLGAQSVLITGNYDNVRQASTVTFRSGNPGDLMGMGVDGSGPAFRPTTYSTPFAAAQLTQGIGIPLGEHNLTSLNAFNGGYYVYDACVVDYDTGALKLNGVDYHVLINQSTGMVTFTEGSTPAFNGVLVIFGA